ncbi:MAG: zinc ribbon domain-containing protein, partial [Thermoplasmatota archaeon]
AMESLELARDFMKEGDYEVAIQFANDAKAVLRARRAEGGRGGEGGGGGLAGGRRAKKKMKAAEGGLRCPGCGENLEPEWAVCPACGHKTR